MTHDESKWVNELFSVDDIHEFFINNFKIDNSIYLIGGQYDNDLFSVSNIDKLLINNFIILHQSMQKNALFSVTKIYELLINNFTINNI